MDMIATTFDIAMFLSRVETGFRDHTDTTNEYYENRHCDASEARTLAKPP